MHARSGTPIAVRVAFAAATALTVSTTGGCTLHPTTTIRIEGTGAVARLSYTFPEQDEKVVPKPGLPFERFTDSDDEKVTVRGSGVTGEVTCRILVNDEEVSSDTSDDGRLTCDYDPDK